MRSRLDSKAAVLTAMTVLSPLACSQSGEDGHSAAGGSGAASGAASGGSRLGSGGSTTGADSSSGGATSSDAGRLGSGGVVSGTGGAVDASGGATTSGGQTGSGGAGPGGGTGGKSTGSAGRSGGGSPSVSGGAANSGAGTANSGAGTANSGAGTANGGAGAANGGAGAANGGAGAANGGAGAANGGGGGAAGCDEVHGYHLTAKGDACTNEPRKLCIFDYDLVLSSHGCQRTTSMPAEYLCRTNACTTYAWHDQCLATGAHAAIAECVRHGAYIGIASHSNFEACWNDKVIQTLTPAAFPELFSSVHYDKSGSDFTYPAIDKRANWNCDTCAYHFDGAIAAGKSGLIRKVMAHYGLSATSAADQSRVLYWDDDPSYLQEVHTNLPNVSTTAVASTNPSSNGAGCGIQPADVSAGWAAIAAKSP